MYDIVIGRQKKDVKKFGTKGSVFIGKQYVVMGPHYSLSNNIFLDVSTTHVIYICGKRGSGKSYTMAVIAEGLADLEEEYKNEVASVIFDTMGIFWTMKYPNKQDELLLSEWGIEPKSYDVKVYVPAGFYEKLKKEGFPADLPFSISPMELDSEDWHDIFGIDPDSDLGVLFQELVSQLKDKGKKFGIDEMIQYIDNLKEFDQNVRLAAKARLKAAKGWGLFAKEATPIKEIVKGGQISIIDVSIYNTMPNGWNIKSLVVGIISKILFEVRMLARKEEELNEISAGTHILFKPKERKVKYPLTWIFIDEAHEFLPRKGKTLATKPLITLLREGRQPGISLVLATQQPGKMHTDVVTQSDIVIGHRITARIDVEALEGLTQTYMQESLVKSVDKLPREKGAAVIFDDTNEKIFSVRIRPRKSWHGGSSPQLLKEE